MSDTKQSFNWQTIALVALVGYVVWMNWKPASDDVEDDDKQVVVEPISKVLAKAYDADRRSKIAILKALAKEQFVDDVAKDNWIAEESERLRRKDFKDFTDRMGDAIFDGTTEEMAKALEAGK